MTTTSLPPTPQRFGLPEPAIQAIQQVLMHIERVGQVLDRQLVVANQIT